MTDEKNGAGQAISALRASVPSAGGDCGCRLCSYSREYEVMIALVPEPARAFFADMYERYEATDFDLDWSRACLQGIEWRNFERHSLAQAIEARRAATGTGAVHESAVGSADAPESPDHE